MPVNATQPIAAVDQPARAAVTTVQEPAAAKAKAAGSTQFLNPAQPVASPAAPHHHKEPEPPPPPPPTPDAVAMGLVQPLRVPGLATQPSVPSPVAPVDRPMPPVVVEKAKPAPEPAPAPAARKAAVAPKPVAGTIVAELGTQSASNFYKGLAGNDVIEHGGIFVATYKPVKIGATVALHVHLPGNYEFQATGVVQWTRDPGTDEPGFGARLTQISAEGRQLVYRYTHNREPMFYDDL